MSWDLLQRFIESDHFNNDPFLPVAYLSRYANHVGIHYVLCSKLRQFSYEEIEFFLPQLCHLVVSVDNESMALEEFIVDLCAESANGALLTFWLFQTHLHDLAGNPQSNEFKTCRRVFNRVQRIVFGSSEPPQDEKLKENILPVMVLASLVLAGVASPALLGYAGPLAIGQARKPRFSADTISDTSQTQKLVRSHTVAVNPKYGIKKEPNRTVGDPSEADSSSMSRRVQHPHRSTSERRKTPAYNKDGSTINLVKTSRLEPRIPSQRLSSTSLPDVSKVRAEGPASLLVPTSSHHTGIAQRPRSREARPLPSSGFSKSQKAHLLRSNYFRCESQFLTALEDISNRLVIVPKAARLSALRAELALIARDLPVEVDIPVIRPPTLVNGSPSRSKHHRIVRLNPAEATVLNSAERVPYLLMVEILLEDFDFDPTNPHNEELLEKLIFEDKTTPRRLFDLTEALPPRSSRAVVTEAVDSVFEPINGDLGSPALIMEPEENPFPATHSYQYHTKDVSKSQTKYEQRWLSAQRSATANLSEETPTKSGAPHSQPGTTSSPGQLSASASEIQLNSEQLGFPGLATHMRAAAQMLAQLDSSGAKRPKDEVAAIREKIIASMQSLEEQVFDVEDTKGPLTFEVIIPNSMGNTSTQELPKTEHDHRPNAAMNDKAGAARMENDQKTGGMQQKADRDDPSAVTFGEEWSAKKERIRKSSPFGSISSWDLLSVIVKTGADLRQEAFACQLIQICGRIWHDAEIPVWVKQIRILVTGESSGLIETITNGVSLHSIKRSLTLSTIAARRNPRRGIASLKDHFVKSFGEPMSESYRAAQAAFLQSLAAYSIFSYVFQLKDRHNGNLLIDNHGHIIHIDFGFMLSNSPGSVGFEAAPFKLTQEYVDVLGGPTSLAFEAFKSLCKRAFQALRKSADSIILLVEMMGNRSKMPCFAAGSVQVVGSLRQRFQLQLSQEDAERFVETDLIAKSCGSYYTRLYDAYQYRTQGIY